MSDCPRAVTEQQRAVWSLPSLSSFSSFLFHFHCSPLYCWNRPRHSQDAYSLPYLLPRLASPSSTLCPTFPSLSFNNSSPRLFPPSRPHTYDREQYRPLPPAAPAASLAETTKSTSSSSSSFPLRRRNNRMLEERKDVEASHTREALVESGGARRRM